jgi:hypothetical protein
VVAHAFRVVLHPLGVVLHLLCLLLVLHEGSVPDRSMGENGQDRAVSGRRVGPC